MGRDITEVDIHIQFIGTYEGLEGDSASISVMTAVISAMEGVPVRQDTAMTGSLSIRGTVLPIGGATAKVEAAAKAGIKRILVPKSNLNDVLVEDKFKKDIKVIPVETLTDVIENALQGDGKQDLLKKLKAMKPLKVTGKVELDSEKKMIASSPEIKKQEE
jgi:Lon-like ATP-dependent protease